MDLSRLNYFVGVAQAGSFSRAATELNMSQSALSRQVALLEAELGQPLMTRDGRGVVLTESGQALLAHARDIFALAERAHADLQDRHASPRGQVTVGLPPRVAHALAADIVQAFRAEYPDAVITVVEGLSIRLREWLVAGRLDLAILFDPMNSPQLQLDTVAREPLVLVSPHAVQPRHKRIKLEELAALQLVMPRAPNALRQLLEDHCRPRGLTLQIVAEVDSVQTVLSLVARGVAHTVLPASAVRAWTGPGKLHVTEIHSPALRNRVVLAVPKARPATRTSRFAVSLVRELAAAHYQPLE